MSEGKNNDRGTFWQLSSPPSLILKDFLFRSLEISEGGKKGTSHRAAVQCLSEKRKPASTYLWNIGAPPWLPLTMARAL